MKKIISTLIFIALIATVHAQNKTDQPLLSIRKVKIMRQEMIERKKPTVTVGFLLQLDKKDYTGSRNGLIGRCGGEYPIIQPDDSLVAILVAFPYTRRGIRRYKKCKYYTKQFVGMFQKQLAGQYAGKWLQIDLWTEKIPKNQPIVYSLE